MTAATLSVITTIKPARLLKGYSLGAGGALLKSPGGILVQGEVETRDLSTLADFAAILEALSPAQALVHGVPVKAADRVMTRKAFADAGRPEGATTRTNDAFAWPPGAGVLMMHYDPPTGCDASGRDGLVQAIRTAAPGLAGLGCSGGVVTGPTIRLDGSVLDAPVYDPATRLMFDLMGEDMPDVPMRPTLGQARDALNLLVRPFKTFPFVDANARGAMLAAILTAAVRPVLPTSPAFAFDAPIQGSGKTLLASCVGALIEGRSPDIWPHTQGRDDEETRKRLFTALRTGCWALVWENVTSTFDSASMAAFVTVDAMIDRVLGKSEAIRIPNRALLILTGNNMSLAGDLPRRVIICRIDPQTDAPFARQFDLDPLQWVLEHRAAMLAAACILIIAKFTRMKTPAPGRLASFEAWDGLVRQTVCWADVALRPRAFEDPMDLIRAAEAADSESDALFSLLDALRDQFGAAEFNAKDVQVQAKASMTQSPFELALLDLAGDRALALAKSLGRVLKFGEGRICHGLRMAGRQDKHAGGRMYRIRAVEPEKADFGGYSGFLSSHMEKATTPPLYMNNRKQTR